ncbi:MAG: ASCH domain-containing protein [Alphaproteobacteria bacterium]|nr:ASCH domain-containing protein [Alphaproteobacteria bacterium]
MMFTKKLREPIRRGEITTSIRIWQSPRVKVGNAYAVIGGGQVRVTGIKEIGIGDITPKMARDSGFDGVIDLLKTAKHGRGERVFLVTFVYEGEQPPLRASSAPRPSSPRRGRRPSGER